MIQKKLFVRNNEGQLLIEAIIALGIGMVVIVALLGLGMRAINNANLAYDKVLAEKFAQEGLEWVRSYRDSDAIKLACGLGGLTCARWSDLWSVPINSQPTPALYFKLLQPALGSSNCGDILGLAQGSSFTDWNYLTRPGLAGNDCVATKFIRNIRITDTPADYASIKEVTIVVSWTDATGTHQQMTSTKLGKKIK